MENNHSTPVKHHRKKKKKLWLNTHPHWKWPKGEPPDTIGRCSSTLAGVVGEMTKLELDLWIILTSNKHQRRLHGKFHSPIWEVLELTHFKRQWTAISRGSLGVNARSPDMVLWKTLRSAKSCPKDEGGWLWKN